MNKLENLINFISKGQSLSLEESKLIFLEIMSGKLKEKHIHDFLVFLVDFLMKNLPRFLPIAKFALKNARLYGEIKRPIEGSKILRKICQVSSPLA